MCYLITSIMPLSLLFPRASWYAGLADGPADRVREAGPAPFAYSERHLQCVWYDRRLRPARLLTTRGEAVLVLSPGRWNLQPGPDFLGAILIVSPDQRRLEGDIEIHTRPADWNRHGHDRDPAYRRVIAHVTWHTPQFHYSLPREAVEIPLAPALGPEAPLILDHIDLSAYPYAAFPEDPTPCRAVMRELSPAARLAVVRAAGEERLRRKTVRLAGVIAAQGPEQALYEECMAGLGYSRNQRAFRELARRLPVERLRGESASQVDTAYALLLGVGGLLPREPGPDWDAESRAVWQGLWRTWWRRSAAWAGETMETGAWNVAALRPANTPWRRLAAAAALFCGPPAAPRLQRLPTNPPETWYEHVARLLDAAEGMPFWRHRLSWSQPPLPAPVALLGVTRRAAVVTNVLLPFLAALDTDIRPLLAHLPPDQPNGLMRQAGFRLFGRDHNPAPYQEGMAQQGLLQIFHDYCLSSREGCAGCALPDLLRTALPPPGADVPNG